MVEHANGTTPKHQDATAIKALVEGAASRGFMEVMELIERFSAAGSAPIGGAASPRAEVVRLRHDPSLAFSSGEVASVSVREGDPLDGGAIAFEIITSFLGLTGSVSPAPSHLLEDALEDSPAGQARRDFLDVFQHRLLSLFYRATRKFEHGASYRSDASDVWSRRLLQLCGFPNASGTTGSQPTAHLALRLAPVLAGGASRSAEALEKALIAATRDYISGATLTVRQFVVSWIEVAAEDRPRLGSGKCRLRDGVLIGRRIRDLGSKVDLVIGPLRHEQYLNFLPGNSGFEQVRSTIAMLGQDTFEYDLVLTLLPDEHREVCLSSKSTQALGRSTWLARSTRGAAQLEMRVPLREG